MSETLIRLAGWSAVVNGATSILITVTIALMFAAGGPWGNINDAISVIWGLSFIPLAWFFYQLLRDSNSTAALVALAIGLLSTALFAALQAALVIDLVEFEQTFQIVTFLGTGIGMWLVINGLLARGRPALPASLVIVTLILGASYLLAGIGFVLSGWEHPLALAGFATSALIGPVWAFMLARFLLSGRLAAVIVA